MKQFVIEVDGKKTLDFELLEEEYGEDLVRSLKNQLAYADKEELDWKLEVKDDPRFLVEILFCIRYCVVFYSVLKERKTVVDKYHVGSADCKRFLELMSSLEKVEQ